MPLKQSAGRGDGFLDVAANIFRFIQAWLLRDEAEKGNDPDDLLSLIGADQSYWDPFLTVFRSDGRNAAVLALSRHLGLPV